MSLFDSIVSEYKYIIEDDIGEDEEDNDNPDDYNMDNAGQDEDDNQLPEDQPEDDQPPEDANPDDFDMNNAGQDEGQPEQDTPPEEGQDAPEGEEGSQDANPDDFDMGNADQDTGEEGMDDGQGDADTTGQDDASAPPEEDYQDPSDKLRALEKSIFDQLSPEQQKLKIKELKSLYNDVYDKCDKILDIVVTAEKVPSQTKVYDYITNNITDLQKCIRDYLENIFDSKTYMENMTELQKYMAILDTVNNVFEELKQNNEKQFKDE